MLFFFNDTATTEIYTLSLHDALPISRVKEESHRFYNKGLTWQTRLWIDDMFMITAVQAQRSEEHTSELQSRQYLVCRLLLEKKKISPSAAREKHESHH